MAWTYKRADVPTAGKYQSIFVRCWVAASGVLALAAFNLTFRLGHEIVVEWDESLYGVTAWELFQNHQWVATTFKNTLDYYNTKPPLNVWLISLSFHAFGVNLISLRLPAILSAWATVLVLFLWTRRAFGQQTALLASLVLSTLFGFFYDHSGRNANTDAMFTLLILLTVVTVWAADHRPWQLIWLGPIAAATFLLRGMGVLMPMAIVCLVEARRAQPWRHRIPPLLIATVLFLVPTGAWVWQRWHLDQWQFLGPLFSYDFVARTVRVLEGHRGTPFYHLNVLQKNHYDWLFGGLMALGLFPIGWSRAREWVAFWRGNDTLKLSIGSWVCVTLLMPTLMRTKVSWYLNPFYPVFALLIAGVLVHAFGHSKGSHGSRRMALIVTMVVVFVVAESRLMWYSVHRRSLAQSTQGFLLAERSKLNGHRVFRTRWDNAELFVLDALVGAQALETSTVETFLIESVPGDYWLNSLPLDRPELDLTGSHAAYSLYRRRE